MVNYEESEIVARERALKVRVRLNHFPAAAWIYQQPGGKLAFGGEIVRESEVNVYTGQTRLPDGGTSYARLRSARSESASSDRTQPLFLSSTYRDRKWGCTSRPLATCYMDIRLVSLVAAFRRRGAEFCIRHADSDVPYWGAKALGGGVGRGQADCISCARSYSGFDLFGLHWSI